MVRRPVRTISGDFGKLTDWRRRQSLRVTNGPAGALPQAEGEALLASEKHAYHALQRSQWESHCSDSARSHGVNFVSQKKLKDVAAAQILDSRPPAIRLAR
jgi:hypothetical protein